MLLALLPFPLFAQAPSQTPSPTPLTIDPVATPIRVDGHLADWPSARMIFLGRPSQVTLGRAFWKGVDDFSGRVFLTYDSQYLYVAAVVRKTGRVVGAAEKDSLWNGDCLELFLSTRPDFKSRTLLGRGDYHIGLSPGTDCGNPQMYCFNRNTGIGGGRFIARKTLDGYLLEACIPLSFLQGLDLGPGKTAGFNVALDEGGPVSGNRIVQLDDSGNPLSWQSLASWSTLRWNGDITESFPLEPLTDLYADLVKDGTQGALYLGRRDLRGRVTDAEGNPLAGARVQTWPRTRTVLTDASGGFELEGVKAYDTTVIYGAKQGYATSLEPLSSKGRGVTVRLPALPGDFETASSRVSPFFLGLSLPFPAAADGAFTPSLTGDQVKDLHPEVLKLEAPPAGTDPGTELAVLDRFTAFARGLGAEPMIEVPLGKDAAGRAARWVEHLNVQGKAGVRFWAVGGKPDALPGGASEELGDYNAYDYVNDFREIYNAMKREDPSIFILGPELEGKYVEGDRDWLTPVIRYDGDIVNMASVYHYGVLRAGDYGPGALLADLEGERSLIRSVRGKVSENAVNPIPLLVTGGSACAQSVTVAGKGAADSDFWAALWKAVETGEFLREHVGMSLFSLAGIDPAGVQGRLPATYWALKFWGGMIRGKILAVESTVPGLWAYATQDPVSRDVTLLIVNLGDRYVRPKMLLDGRTSDFTVDAGLDQRFEYEVPSYSLSLLKINAGRAGDQASLYTLKMAREGKGPEVSAIKPW